MRADEATHMLERGAAALGGLLLQAAQRPQLALSLDHVLDRFETDGANQLVLEVGVAHVKVDLYAVGGQVATATPRQRFQRDTVTVALDDHDRPGLHHARDLFMSTRSPFMTTPSLTRRSRWCLPAPCPPAVEPRGLYGRSSGPCLSGCAGWSR